jgi:glycosyltransferase involved in cell wall biosynthesis
VVKLSVFSTHPIQYQVPWFQRLAAQPGLDLKVYYALIPDAEQQGVGFGVPFTWDIPMLEGYDWELLPNEKSSPGLRGFFASSTPTVYTILKKARPDVVIITGWQSLPLLQALWACIKLGLPRLIRSEANALRARRWWVKPLHRLLLARFHAFIAIGKANREFYLRNGIDAARIFTGPYFVDNRRFQEQFSQAMTERQAIRASWNVLPSHTCYLYAGKLEPKKRIMDLLHAFEQALRDNRALHLLVAGTGELMSEAQAFAHSRGLPVSLAGFFNQTEITRAYAAADCLVLPSDYGETWGLVVNEAMACGLPAIVSDRVGCGPDLIEEGKTGAIFPFGDIDALAGLLVGLANDPSRLARMGHEAQERIRNYSVEQAVSGTLAAVDFVLNHHSRTQTVQTTRAANR